ncbi:hypothetical protein [Kitasatospora sp. CB02891]|uniref:hypothetical protein n=1 Tax=Kitasatospora sp. CB02891 TaxID=2020329 RepID=UPI0018E23BDD|nr:hypothetical protein [Kitasatospora sp. CB02891]
MTEQPNRIATYLANLIAAETVQPFVLRRHHDITGVSGTGIVADGALFPAAGKGKAVVRWRGERGSTVVWDHIGHVKEIHGHDGATVIELMPVGELIAALRAVAAIPTMTANEVGGDDDPEYRGAVAGYNDALADVHQAIIDAIEALHDHDEDSF